MSSAKRALLIAFLLVLLIAIPVTIFLISKQPTHPQSLETPEPPTTPELIPVSSPAEVLTTIPTPITIPQPEETATISSIQNPVITQTITVTPSSIETTTTTPMPSPLLPAGSNTLITLAVFGIILIVIGVLLLFVL